MMQGMGKERPYTVRRILRVQLIILILLEILYGVVIGTAGLPWIPHFPAMVVCTACLIHGMLAFAVPEHRVSDHTPGPSGEKDSRKIQRRFTRGTASFITSAVAICYVFFLRLLGFWPQ